MSKLKNLGPVVEHAGTGYRMPEATARRIDELSKGLPADCAYRRKAVTPESFQLEPGERCDVSTITTDAPDREDEVVLPGGIDRDGFNNVVFYAHRYTDELPVGRCLWIKPTTNGRGLIAKTFYPPKPADWGDAPWLPSAILHLMQNGVCTGKSIGFLPLSARRPTRQELSARPEWDGAKVIDRCALLEYSVCGIPVSGGAEMLAVSKAVSDGVFDKSVADIIVKGFQPAPAPRANARETIVLTSQEKSMTDAARPGDGTDDTAAAPAGEPTEKPVVAPDAPEKKHEFGTVHAVMPPAVAKHARAMGRRIKDEHLHEAGAETRPHVTVKHGTHDSVTADHVKALLAGEPAPTMTFGKTDVFSADGPDGHDVVHVAVHSPDLDRLHHKLAGNLPNTNTHGPFRAHLTLGYARPGMGEQYKGMDDLDGMSVKCKSLAFSDTAGNEHEMPMGEDADGDDAPARISAKGYFREVNGSAHYFNGTDPGKGGGGSARNPAEGRTVSHGPAHLVGREVGEPMMGEEMKVGDKVHIPYENGPGPNGNAITKVGRTNVTVRGPSVHGGEVDYKVSRRDVSHVVRGDKVHPVEHARSGLDGKPIPPRKAMTAANESAGADGGFAVPPDDTAEETMPACPKCMTADAVYPHAETKGAYACAACGGKAFGADGAELPDGDADDDADEDDASKPAELSTKAKGPTRLNPRAVSKALALAAAGDIDPAPWDAAAAPHRTKSHADAHLGFDTHYTPDDAGRYLFPVMAAGKVSLAAVGTIAAHAKAHGYTAVAAAAARIAAACDAHALKQAKALPPRYDAKAVDAYAARFKAQEADRLAKVIDEAVEDRICRMMGKV